MINEMLNDQPTFSISVDIINNTIINPLGTHEITIFFDYNCSYCKKELQILRELIRNNKDIRLIIKPIPILGEFSLKAAEVGHAILAYEPNKYLKYLRYIMDEFNFDDDLIYKALVFSDVNIERTKFLIDVMKKTIDSVINNDLKLSKSFGITATPTFIINNKVVCGIFEFEKLKEKIFASLN